MKKIAKMFALSFAVVVMAVAFAACAPTKDSAKKKLEAKEYAVTVIDDADKLKVAAAVIAAVDSDLKDVELKAVVEANKGLNEITVYYFKKTADAKKYYEKIKDVKLPGRDNVIKGSVVAQGADDALKILGLKK